MDRSNAYDDLEWAIGLNRFMLKIIGLWPQQSEDQREELISKFQLLFNVIIITFVLMIPAFMSLIRVWGDMILMIDNLQYTLPILTTIMKIFIMWHNKGALSSLINMIVKDWMRVKIEKERNVMLKQARIARLFTISGGLLMFSVLLIKIGSVLLGLALRHETNITDYVKPLLVQLYYLHNVSSSPKYELTCLVQIIASIACGLSYTAIDNFLGLLILHICGQMENLHLRLLNLGKASNFREILKYNVKDHNRLIRSVEIVDDIFYLMLLGLLFLFGILFCLHGFLIINNVNRGGHLSVMQSIWYVGESVSFLMHMCLYCAVGELLVIQSEKIHGAPYEYVWYTLEPTAARNITLIMLRAKKPVNITAGKIFPMTMATFCNLLKTSAGYVSILLANRDNKRINYSLI